MTHRPADPFFDTSSEIPGTWFRPLRPLVEALTGIRRLNTIHRALPDFGGDTARFAHAALERLAITWRFDGETLPAPAGQGMLVLSNHPTGIIEALILIELLEAIAPSQWSLITNSWMNRKAEFSKVGIPLNPFGWDRDRTMNRRSLRRAASCLKNGGILGAFPAGRVARRIDRSGRAIDEPWSPHLLRLARNCGADILLVRMDLTPGTLLRLTPLAWPMVRALTLPREALRRRHGPVRVSCIAAPASLPTDAMEATRHLHQLCQPSHDKRNHE